MSLATYPHLSPSALQLLENDPSGEVFRAAFGDYYVAAFRIGGSNATLVSAAASSASDSMDLAVQVTAKLLFVKKTFNYDEHERHESFSGQITVAGYDSLEGWKDNQTGASADVYGRLKPIADQNLARARTVDSRSNQRIMSLGIEHGSTVDWPGCDALCREGLVSDLVLLPFSGLRSYVSGRLAFA